MPAGGTPVPHGFTFSDDFSTDKLGVQWSLFRAGGETPVSVRIEDNALRLQTRGSSPKVGAILAFIAGDHDYEMQVEVDSDTEATAGLLVHYSERLFAGLGFSDQQILEYGKGDTTAFPKPLHFGRRFFLRLRNANNVMTTWPSADGKEWKRHWIQFEVSGYHHNVAGAFLSLRPALFAAGQGTVCFRDFRYSVL